MTTLKNCFCLAILLMSIGCLENKVGSRQPFSAENEVKVAKACRDIKLIGDIQSLLYKVHTNTDKILNLSGQPQPAKYLARITLLGDEIETAIEQIKTLTKSEWTATTLNLKTRWVLHPKDFSPASESDGLIIYDRIKIRTVVANGKEQELLLEQVHYTVDSGANIIVTLDKPASILETCELINTIAVIIEVRYKGFGRYENSLPTVGYKTFQLVLNAKD